jgi:hypothetical protein
MKIRWMLAVLCFSNLTFADPYGEFIFLEGQTAYDTPPNTVLMSAPAVPASLKDYIYLGDGWGENVVAYAMANSNLGLFMQADVKSFDKITYSYRVDQNLPVTVVVDKTVNSTEIPIPADASNEVEVTVRGIDKSGKSVLLGHAKAWIIARFGLQLGFELPTKSAPTQFGGAGNGSLKITYDNHRLVALGCNAPKMFSTAKIKFLSADKRTVLAQEAQLGDFTEVDTQTLFLKAPIEARSGQVWFEGKNDSAVKPVPDCFDGNANAPFTFVIN